LHSIILVAVPSPLVEAAVEEAVRNPKGFAERLQDAASDAIGPAITILVIVAISFLLLRMLRSVIRKTITRMIERREQPHRELTIQANTLASVVESVGRMVILVVAGMMILSSLGLNIAPLIASAGVAGIAIGLSAQSLIKDFINGFFILFEDQYAIGDVISVNGNSGLVEHLNLRRTSLRTLDGKFIIIPNGDIRTGTNMTKGWSRALIDVDISYDDDVDHALAVLRDLLDGIDQDPEIGSSILEPAEILGVEALGQYQVTIRFMVKTLPMDQWSGSCVAESSKPSTGRASRYHIRISSTSSNRQMVTPGGSPIPHRGSK
jgi:small-conductance mechanosensitive channel